MSKLIAKLIGLISLLLLTLPSVLFLAGRVSLDAVKEIMIIATIVWFVVGTYWMWPRGENASQQQ